MKTSKPLSKNSNRCCAVSSPRVEKINAAGDFVDYTKLDTLTIGVCGGDGIGPIITEAAQRVLEYLLADEVKAGKVNSR